MVATTLVDSTGSGRVPRSRRPRRPVAFVPVIPFLVLVVIAIAGPLLVPFDPERVVGPATMAPSGEHWFGTDATGMDVFSRVIAATRINFFMALIVTVVATILGLVIGLLVGMSEARTGASGVVGRGINRIVDLSDAIPALIVGIVVVGLFGPSILSLTVALSFIMVPNQVRLTRAEVLRVRGDAYVDAARMAGQRPLRIMFRHVLPNACRPAIENSSLVFGISIIVSASLGFLGVGLVPPTPEWGAMIASGVSDVMLGTWWTTLFPALALCVAVASAAAVSGVLTALTRGGSPISR
ncbi:MAG: ABC transporter permease [Microbacterium sp.]|uniref:ABC transporter permease n=1 Tax=Microbacterium sp. TaxID=51671 RepID=UPI002722607B|nr:ABC transporter permease [Microbacterium sp.]MDO8383957.1 ABC transporter permease [Microbacterium sp.]